MTGRPVTTGEMQRVREMWGRGDRDSAMAAELGRNPRVIGKIRARLDLPSNYGPGRPTNDERRTR